MSRKTNGEPRSKLYLRTIQLLRDRPREISLNVIHLGTGLPRDWLVAILRDPHSSPSVDRIEKLYEYLSGNVLDVR